MTTTTAKTSGGRGVDAGEKSVNEAFIQTRLLVVETTIGDAPEAIHEAIKRQDMHEKCTHLNLRASTGRLQLGLALQILHFAL
jgi:hypothetical protein